MSNHGAYVVILMPTHLAPCPAMSPPTKTIKTTTTTTTTTTIKDNTNTNTTTTTRKVANNNNNNNEQDDNRDNNLNMKHRAKAEFAGVIKIMKDSTV